MSSNITADRFTLMFHKHLILAANTLQNNAILMMLEMDQFMAEF